MDERDWLAKDGSSVRRGAEYFRVDH
jgi:hypothetical protein